MKHTKEDTLQEIITAIKTLTDKGTKPTQKNIAIEVKLSTWTIKKYWDRVNPSTDKTVNPEPQKRVKDESNKVQKGEPISIKKGEPKQQGESNRVNPASPFERLKRRTPHDEVKNNCFALNKVFSLFETKLCL